MMAKFCDGCRFWSEMLAMANGNGTAAICLNQRSPMRGVYMSASLGCAEWKSNHHGAIDCPPDDGATASALYEAEEAAKASGKAVQR